ncbi:MAG: dTMP kinase [Candidatus Thalassarchaeaceae archaeon]|nr:dTMP kinase [Candidatus Thalassarchaeaceae archaeon]
MYLFSIEGGDGSGKGLATQIVHEVLQSEFCFRSVEVTAEPRRDHALGRLAIDSVRRQTLSPEQEAGLFAADRLDHSHGWILPRLQEGRAVVSGRNVHSSLVYQGIVGGIGLERTAQINSAALIPDLCIWVDCDPEIALERISKGTLRDLSSKEEYFETSELQIRIRDGYRQLLSGEMEMPTPFDMGAILGPISNEGTQNQLHNSLREAIRSFMNSRPTPINVEMEQVDQLQIRAIVRESQNQSTLPDIGITPPKTKLGWLDGDAPWKVLKSAQESHKKSLSSMEKEHHNYPKNILNHSMSSICGTLSLINSAEISELRSSMGPVRCVSKRHTQRIIRFLKELGWVYRRKNLVGREAPKSQLREEIFPFGRLVLAIWPLRKEISKWQSLNPGTHIRFSLGQMAKSGRHERALMETISRLSILGSGIEGRQSPENIESLVDWWLGK